MDYSRKKEPEEIRDYGAERWFSKEPNSGRDRNLSNLDVVLSGDNAGGGFAILAGREGKMILAFGHKARQGKDTAGEAVVEFYNTRRKCALVHYGVCKTNNAKEAFAALYPEARIFKFADELYRICREEYGMTEKDAPLLQRIGDGRREQFGHNYWINRLADKVVNFKGVAVITDVRYTNEAQWVENIGGHCINVRRLNENGTPYVAPDRDPNFISEIQLDGYNYEYHIVAKTGQAALVGDLAITIAEHIRALES